MLKILQIFWVSGIILISTSQNSYPQEAEVSNQDSIYQQSDASWSIDKTPLISSNLHLHFTQEKDEQSREIEIQESMESATWRLEMWSFWQTLLLAIGTAFVGYTLYLMVQANRAATQAARAADHTVKITEKLGRVQSRAYVAPTKGQLHKVDNSKELIQSNPENGDFGIQFIITIENCGQTPALNFQHVMKVGPYTVNEVESLSLNYEAVDSVSILMPGESNKASTWLYKCFLNTPINNSLGIQENQKFWVKGKLKYDDIFGTTWECRYIKFINNPDSIRGAAHNASIALTSHSNGNVFTSI